MSDDRDRDDLPARVAALDAVITVAVENVGKSSWRQRFTTSSVMGRTGLEPSHRTVRRACVDAEQLGWVEKKRQEWIPGPRAKQLAAGKGVKNTMDEDQF